MSEDASRQLLAEHAVKIQLSAHEILLYVLQRPLMIGQLQRLPLSLKSQQTRVKDRPTLTTAKTAEYTLKALLVSAGIAMAAPLICSCMILD